MCNMCICNTCTQKALGSAAFLRYVLAVRERPEVERVLKCFAEVSAKSASCVFGYGYNCNHVTFLYRRDFFCPFSLEVSIIIPIFAGDENNKGIR